MAGITVVDYLSRLTVADYSDPLCYLIEQQLSAHPLVDEVAAEFKYVLKCMNRLSSFNRSAHHFDSDFIRRVVAKFRTDPEVQAMELQILDALLVQGQKEFGLTSAKVPAILKIRRDKPLIRPDSLLMANAASRLRHLLLSEHDRPSASASSDHLRGRLLLYLYFMERVETIEQAMFMLNLAPRPYYADGVVYLEFHYKSVLCRYVLSEPGALLWMQWLERQRSISASVKLKSPSYYISLYLSAQPDWHHDALGLIKLKLLRKIDYSLRYSPIQFGIYSGYMPSQLLRPEAFVRLLTDRQVPYGEEDTASGGLLTVREQRAWQGKQSQAHYCSVTTQQAELRRVLACLRPPAGMSASAPLATPKTELIKGLTLWLEQNVGGYSPYLWFLIAWARSLYKEGGRVKRNLKPSTIVDYVTTIGATFLGVFNGIQLLALDGVDWVELLNRTADEVKSPSRKGFVLYFATFLRDADLVPDLPVSELEIAVSHGSVDANLLSVSHAEAILGKLAKQQDAVSRDAYLLFCLCFYSGLRRNEAAFLQLADLDFATVEPNGSEYDHVDLFIRRNQKRGLKSSAANRVLPLDALWPMSHLSVLRSRIQYQQVRGGGPLSPLFDSPQRAEQAYRLITDLMHTYTGDLSLRVHHLRHSFANWLWFRLHPDLLALGRKQLGMFQGGFFSDSAVARLYLRLGIQPYSRKGMYVMCHLLGHEEPTTTIGSYLHLKDLTGYLSLGAQFSTSKKLLAHTLGRSLLRPRCDIGDSLALRLSYETRALELLVSPQLSPAERHARLPSIKELEHCFNLGKRVTPKQVLEWASILMSCKACSPEQIAYQQGLPSSLVRLFLDNAAKVQRFCPARGKRLPLIPALSPWISVLIAKANNEPAMVEAMTEQQGANTGITDVQITKIKRPNSHSLRVIDYLFAQLQTGLDNGRLTWQQIKDGCQIMKYLVPAKGYLIRSPSSYRVIKFLKLCALLGLKARHIRLKLHLGDMDDAQSVRVLASWSSFLSQTGMDGLVVERGLPHECPYLRKHDGMGVMEVSLVNRSLRLEGRRQRVFISMLQLMLILSLSLMGEPSAGSDVSA